MYGYEPAAPLDRVVEALQDKPSSVEHVEAVAQMLDRMADDVVKARASMSRAQERMAQQANKHRRDVKFEVGDKVMLSSKHVKLAGVTRKFAPRWLGPFEVIKVVNDAAVKLALSAQIKLHPVVHVSLVKHVFEDERWLNRQQPPPPPVIVEGETMWDVEAILKHRTVRRGRSRKEVPQYLVKWEGYPIWECTWEPASSFPRQNSVFSEYKSKHGL
jgi:hypothetical protein